MPIAKSITIHCVAEGYQDNWTAICLDFDIAVQGNSLQEVKNTLSEAILSYLEEVKTYPEKERLAFLRRRAPLSLCIKYWLMALTNFFFFKLRSEKKNLLDFFTEQVACVA